MNKEQLHSSPKLLRNLQINKLLTLVLIDLDHELSLYESCSKVI